MLVLFRVWTFGFSIPSSCVWVLQLQTDRRELSNSTCHLFTMSVSVRRDCLKGKAEFQKDFQTFGTLSFEKSVEERMSRAEVFTFGDLDLC